MAEADDVPTVTVLVLGEPRVGKSTFLSRLMQSAHTAPLSSPSLSSSSSTTTLVDPSPSPSPSSNTLHILPPSTQPHAISLRLHNRAYRLLFYDTDAPTPFTALAPDLLILAFDVSRRKTLDALRDRWLPLADVAFNRDERVAVLVLGLGRDRRDGARYRDESEGDEGKGGCREESERDREAGDGDGGTGDGEDDGGGVVTPHEALAVAQAMRCDRYAECSALTGELCGLVVEDVAKMAAAAVGEDGGRTQGGCGVM
ncbi:hypothetical protein IWX90DRAFT_411384 [Phyllosticta citrichinensis]|uniref:P-loop containing nucleoside triphosphate hydrolase protein n=1 Tax=Phyllosticta citrichinensis TaxID=1130410 RepID=A0ABR1Y7W5_9PEZI